VNGLVLVVFYGSILFCIFACAYKVFVYARVPMHIRWEIYKDSSIYETGNWWRKKGGGRSQKPDNLFKNAATLKEYYKNNKLFWLPLYLFHLGVYLLITWHAWLFIYPLVFHKNWPVGYSLIWGHTATGLMFAGALGVFISRLASRSLRATYPRWHYFKWLIIMAAAATGYIAVQFYFNGVMAEVLGYVRGQLQFNWADKMNPPLLTSLHVLTVSAVLIYLPFSHAVRLFFRYYHEWRWNYIPGLRSARVSEETKNMLEYPITWAAKHATVGTLWKDLA
jgi:nitrate reductase gamma subunit